MKKDSTEVNAQVTAFGSTRNLLVSLAINLLLFAVVFLLHPDTAITDVTRIFGGAVLMAVAPFIALHVWYGLPALVAMLGLYCATYICVRGRVQLCVFVVLGAVWLAYGLWFLSFNG